MNMSGPGRFQLAVNQPFRVDPAESAGNLGSTARKKEIKKLVDRITMERCPATFRNFNFCRAFKTSPQPPKEAPPFKVGGNW
jgi:hypothetical protein